MPFLIGSAILGGGSVLGGVLGGQAQSNAAKRAAAQQAQQHAQSRADLAPFREFGEQELGEFRNWLAENKFSAPTAEEAQAEPGYQFRLGQGTQAIENSAAARGGLLSGNTGRALTDYGQNFASNEYGNIYNRKQGEYQNEINNRMNRINLGYGAAAGGADLGQNYANALSGLSQQQGQGQAAGWNALSNLASGAGGALLGRGIWG